MKRVLSLFLLTLTLASAWELRGQRVPEGATDIELRALQPVGPAGGSALCVGMLNTIRAELALHGAPPSRPIPLRLVLRLPGADPMGTLVAEGSVAFPAGATRTTFTFLNVAVSARLEGRGALLEVRANLDHALTESDPENNVRAVLVDRATDWRCRQ